MFQDLGLQSTMPFCDRLETRNFTSSSTPEGLNTTQGINVAFEAFLTAIAEVDYDNVYATWGLDATSYVYLFTPLAPHSPN
jgi:hypothetical protein